MLVAHPTIEHYNAPKENQIMEKLITINTTSKFPRSKIAERISLLIKFLDTNFADPERYTDNNKVMFMLFKSLSSESRAEVLNNLNAQLLSY